MIELKNVALDRLRAGELALGVGLRQASTVDIAKAMLTAGFDWLFIDMEHNSMDLDTAVQICVAAQDADVAIDHLAGSGHQAWRIGRITAGDGEVELL